MTRLFPILLLLVAPIDGSETTPEEGGALAIHLSADTLNSYEPLHLIVTLSNRGPADLPVNQYDPLYDLILSIKHTESTTVHCKTRDVPCLFTGKRPLKPGEEAQARMSLLRIGLDGPFYFSTPGTYEIGASLHVDGTRVSATKRIEVKSIDLPDNDRLLATWRAPEPSWLIRTAFLNESIYPAAKKALEVVIRDFRSTVFADHAAYSLGFAHWASRHQAWVPGDAGVLAFGYLAQVSDKAPRIRVLARLLMLEIFLDHEAVRARETVDAVVSELRASRSVLRQMGLVQEARTRIEEYETR